MAQGDFKDLKRRTDSDKILRNKAFNVAKNPKYGGYQRGLASMVYKLFDKKSKGSDVVNLLIMRFNKIYNQLGNYTNQLLENLKKEKLILDLKIIFQVLIQLICN